MLWPQRGSAFRVACEFLVLVRFRRGRVQAPRAKGERRGGEHRSDANGGRHRRRCPLEADIAERRLGGGGVKDRLDRDDRLRDGGGRLLVARALHRVRGVVGHILLEPAEPPRLEVRPAGLELGAKVPAVGGASGVAEGGLGRAGLGWVRVFLAGLNWAGLG